MIEVINLWNKYKSVNKIMEIVDISRSGICRYLNNGTKLKMCEYIGQKEWRSKQVICLTTKEIFPSICSIKGKYGTNRDSITKCCDGKIKTSGFYNDIKLKWQYYEDYLEEKALSDKIESA
jgi:hypothetical protein